MPGEILHTEQLNLRGLFTLSVKCKDRDATKTDIAV